VDDVALHVLKPPEPYIRPPQLGQPLPPAKGNSRAVHMSAYHRIFSFSFWGQQFSLSELLFVWRILACVALVCVRAFVLCLCVCVFVCMCDLCVGGYVCD